MLKRLKNILKKDKLLLIVILIWLTGLFLRVYRQGDLLGFYYDQGRDALKVADILIRHDLPAIGPTTGLSGIFLGPFWFYFITPFYWLGRGDPAVAAGFIGLVDSFTVILLYLAGERFFSRKVGFLAAFFWSFSYWLIKSARWFSNPSPLPFFTILMIFGLGEWLINKKTKWIPVILACLGISLQLEAASAIFYFPAIFFLVLLFKIRVKQLVKLKSFWWGAIIFLFSFLPQIFFELKNNFLMTKNLLGFFLGRVNTDSGRSWAVPTLAFIKRKMFSYYQTLWSHLDPNLVLPSLVFVILLVAFLYFLIRGKNGFLKILTVFLLIPLFLLFFFVGNYGNLYGYYLTGFFPVFIFLFAYFLSFFPWIVIFLFLIWFSWQNLTLTKNYLSAGVDGPEHITLGNQKQVIEWVCRDRADREFNVDTYVPPVIPYAWDYLWQWYGCKNLGCCPSRDRVNLLYTVWEVDPPHPERLEAWLERQAGIGKIKKRVRFGGIGVERRERLEY
jgi:4-amino-4-deoxy-L-arabinose transferase-like glycosyltransferase